MVLGELLGKKSVRGVLSAAIRREKNSKKINYK